jgi:hypothetical protein
VKDLLAVPAALTAQAIARLAVEAVRVRLELMVLSVTALLVVWAGQA